MGIQNSGQPVTPKTVGGKVTNIANASLTSITIIAANLNRSSEGLNITNDNPTHSLWVTSDPLVLVATAALPCVEVPPGANYDMQVNTAVRGIWAAGAPVTAGTGCRVIEYA